MVDVIAHIRTVALHEYHAKAPDPSRLIPISPKRDRCGNHSLGNTMASSRFFRRDVSEGNDTSEEGDECPNEHQTQAVQCQRM
jgi:hypothetical protein